jgi:hypothetical protein
MAMIAPGAAAQIAMTTVQGTIYRADGTPASGTVLVTWTGFTTPQNQAVAAGSVSATIGADGFLSVNLTPNAGALPSGSYYTAVYHLSDGTVSTEYWVIPASGTASVASVRAQLQPSTIAVTTGVTPSYVQGALAALGGTYLPLTGGTLTGPLTLNADPVSQNQAATRHYVDQSAAQELQLTGGTLTGPLTTPGLSTENLEGVQYADQNQSTAGSNDGIAMSLAECSTFQYACQVLAPAVYATTEKAPWGGGDFTWSGGFTTPFTGTAQGPAFGQPVGCVEDTRFGGPQWICQTATPPSWGTTGVAVGPAFTVYNTHTAVQGYVPVSGLAVNTYNLAGTVYAGGMQSNDQTLRVLQYDDSPAIQDPLVILQYANSNGDAHSINIAHYQRGGQSTGDSEGAENRYVLQEALDVFRGAVNSVTNQSGSSNVCQGPCTIFSTTQTQGYKGSLGDELELIDLTQADSSGYISQISSYSDGYGNGSVVTAAGADWDTKYGDSQAHSTLSAASGGPTSWSPLNAPVNVTVTVANASGFAAGGNACVIDASGTFWENEPITAVSAANNTLTVAVLRHPFAIGSSVSEGGMACMGMEMMADEVGPGAMNGQAQGNNPLTSTIRSVWPIAWNAAGNAAYTLTSNGGHSVQTLAYAQMGSGGSVSCTLSGGAISACTASGGTGYSNATQGGNGLPSNPPQLMLTGLTGCTSTPVIFVSSIGSGGALSGAGIANNGTSGCSGTPAVAVSPRNAYAIYPMAQTVNVWNPATGAVDGSSIATEPPTGSFNAGDTVEQEHYYTENYTMWRNFEVAYQGSTTETENMLYVGGRNGGAIYDNFNNGNAATLYQGYPLGTPYVVGQGRMQTPTARYLQGPWSGAIILQGPPFGVNSANGQPGMFTVGCTLNGVNVCSSWNSYYYAFNFDNAAGGWDHFGYNPTSETWQWTAGATNSSSAACTINLNSGGLSGKCGAPTWSFDSSGDLALPGSLHASSGVTGATINGEITVDGTTYTTLNAAWNAAAAQATAGGQDQTVRLGPGTFAVSATLTEPANGACVNLIGSAGNTVNADSPQVASTLTVPNALGADVVYLGNAQQAQGCTFENVNILANGNATHGFELQWFRGLLIENVTVNDTSQDGIVLGEENTGHQSNFLLQNVTVSYSAASFTPANRPSYGVHMEKTAIDSALDEITVRNALTAAIYNEGTGNNGYHIHGFGYPYTCTTAPCVNNASSSSAANASYATNYVIYDTGGSGSEWTDTYVDSPAVAGFYVGANGVGINGGHIQWPDLTSFPAANLAYVAAGVTNNLLIGDLSCLGMGSGANWITYAGASGNPPTFSSVHHLTGCGNYYQALEPAVTTGFSSGGANINDPSGAVPRVWATPLAAASTDTAYSAQLYTGYQGDAFQAHFSGVNPFFNITYQGTIRSSGGIALSTVINTASTLTLTAANKNVIANAASGAQTITLPSCYTQLADKSWPTGLELTIIKSDTSSNAVTLQTVSSQLIYSQGASAATLAISSPATETLVCGPDYNWYVAGAAPAVVSAVSTFNGRSGAVTPASGDYSFSQIGGQATNAQLPSSLTGNAATATALAATPSQCPAGSYSTGITAPGSANCQQSWRFTWYGSFAGSFGSSANNSLGAIWSPTAAIAMTRLDIAVGTAPAGCSTWPVIGIYDSTATSWLKTVTLAAGTYSYRNAVSGVSIAAGHNLSMGVQTAGAGCTTNAGTAQLTMEYTMNQ